jgi:hypothetical protein
VDILTFCLLSLSFDDGADGIGHQAVRLAVDPLGNVLAGGGDQARNILRSGRLGNGVTPRTT